RRRSALTELRELPHQGVFLPDVSRREAGAVERTVVDTGCVVVVHVRFVGTDAVRPAVVLPGFGDDTPFRDTGRAAVRVNETSIRVVVAIEHPTGDRIDVDAV